MTVVGGILLLVTVLLWAAVVANSATLNSSDPAGNSLSYAYGVFMVIGLWVLLAVLMVMAGSRGSMTSWAKLAAVILVPASGAASVGAMSLMAGHPSTRWPLIVPVLAPALLLGFALWAYFPAVHARVPAIGASLAVWGGLFLLSVAPWPALAQRSRDGAQRVEEVQSARQLEEARLVEAKRRENLAKFSVLTPASRLWDWMPFTWEGNELRDQALAGARQSPTRQADAEEMLGRGHPFPLLEVSSLNLQATPALCAAAIGFLVRTADDLAKAAPTVTDYDERSEEFVKWIGPIAWLKSNGCDPAAALDALEAGARSFNSTPSRQLFLESVTRLRTRP